jgi:hypothetical protein
MRARLRAAAGAGRLRGLVCAGSAARCGLGCARLRGRLVCGGCCGGSAARCAGAGRLRELVYERLRAAGRLRVGGVVCALGVCVGVCAGMEMDGGDLVDVNGRLGYRWGHGCAWSTLPS